MLNVFHLKYKSVFCEFIAVDVVMLEELFHDFHYLLYFGPNCPGQDN